MKQLHRRHGARVAFLEVLVRQAHPGPDVPPHRTQADKQAEARRYVAEEGLEWPVAVDDLRGTVHQVYGGLSDPTYLLDADGKVAFYAATTHAPTLERAIEALLEQGGRGVVGSGATRLPHLGAAFVHGWRALERGRPQSLRDLHRMIPGSPWLLRLGASLEPLLGPLALRASPILRLRWPAGGRLLLLLGAAATAGVGGWAIRRRLA